MKKSVLSIVAIVAVSASTLTGSAQGMTSQARGGCDPRPQARGGCDPRPQIANGVYTAVLAYFGY